MPINGSTDVADEDKELWDYCSPARVEGIEEDEGGEKFEEAVNLPAMVNRTKRQSGSGGSGFNQGNTAGGGMKVMSALKDVYCQGECLENLGGRHNCDVPGNDPNNFFCSPEVSLLREQISSKKQALVHQSLHKATGRGLLHMQDPVWFGPL